jgi:hypothetical protein
MDEWVEETKETNIVCSESVENQGSDSSAISQPTHQRFGAQICARNPILRF